MIPTAHTFYDTFTHKGKWWLPGTRRKLDGVLTVKAGDEMRVELFGGFKGHAPFKGQPVIHGTVDDGTNVTLFDNIYVSGGFGGAGHVRATYLSNLCVFGVQADERDDVTFKTLRVRLTHLESWAMTCPFSTKMNGTGQENESLTVTFTYPPAVTIRIPDPAMSIVFDSDLRKRSADHV